MDRWAWWATVHRVAKSQTQLKQVSTHTHQQRVLFLGLWGKVLRVENTLGILGGTCSPRWGCALCQLTLGEQQTKYPMEDENPSIVEKDSGWSSWQSSWEAGELGAWVPHWQSPGRHPPFLGAGKWLKQPSRNPVSPCHLLCVCLQGLCSLKPPFWWLFLSLCCSFKKKESRRVGPYCRRMAGHLISTRREACATWEHPWWSRDWPSTKDGCLLGEKLTAQCMEPEKESKHPMVNPQEQLY